MDVDFSDPNIRGATGSIMHAGTDGDRADFERWLKEGMPHDDALQKLAKQIVSRSQRVIEVIPHGDMRTFTYMRSSINDDQNLANRPWYVIGHPKTLFIYTQLSLSIGASPPFYLDTGGTFFMLDNWSQHELDDFASFHGVAAVTRLELNRDEANALIDLANSRTVRNTVPLPTTA